MVFLMLLSPGHDLHQIVHRIETGICSSSEHSVSAWGRLCLAVAKFSRCQTLNPRTSNSASPSADYHAHISDFSATQALRKPSSPNFLSFYRWKSDPCSYFNEFYCWGTKRTRAALLPDQTRHTNYGLTMARTNSCCV